MSSGSIKRSFYSGRTHTRRRRQSNAGESLRPNVSRTSVVPPDIKLEKVKSTESDITRTPINGHFELVVEHPFDSTIKRMSTVWQFIPNDDQDSAEDYGLLLCMSPSILIFGRID